MRPGLRVILDSIQPDAFDGGPAYFVAKPAAGSATHFVGWSRQRVPCVLIETADVSFRAPLQLTGLEVQYCLHCNVNLSGDTYSEKVLTVVSCNSTDIEAQNYFLHLMESLLRILGDRPALSRLIDAVTRLVDIFQLLTRPPRRGVIGLYGELTVIALSSSPVVALSAWRAGLDDRFDFALANVRLETKATSKRVRIHHFSFEQCSPPRGTTGILASMFVEQNGGGQSVRELALEIDEKIGTDNEARVKLHATIAASLGSSLPAAFQLRFDDALARSSLHFFDLTDVPAIREDIPKGVSEVRFRTDLSGVLPRDLKALRGRGEPLRSILPSV